MKNANKGIPARLKQLRREKGITQTELASIIGVQRTTIANWETGVRTPNNNAILSMCRYFDVSPDYLCGLVDVRNVVIAPPSFHIDITKLNHRGQEELNQYYEYLISKEKFAN